MEGIDRRVAIKFTWRSDKHGRRIETTHFYDSLGRRLFHARCERGVILSFLERVNAVTSTSRSGKTIYIEGSGVEDLLRKLIILAGVRQCTKSPLKVRDLVEVVGSLGEFETIFWYSKILEEHERRRYWGVCRVAKAFRILNRID